MSAPSSVVAVRREKKNLSPVLRGVIIERYQRTCQYCGRSSTTWQHDPDGKPWNVDHKTPVEAGGSHDEQNLTLSCAACNLRKGRDVPVVDGVSIVYIRPRRTGSRRPVPGSAHATGGQIERAVARLRIETGEWPSQAAVRADVQLCRSTFIWHVRRLVASGRIERLHGGRFLRTPPGDALAGSEGAAE